MPHRVTLLLVSCLTLFPTLLAEGGQAPAPKQPLPRTDQFGDPLPEGALARLGSVRFHHQGGVIAAAFSPDAKTLLAAGHEQEGISLRFWETATGKELSRILVKGFDFRGLTFAPDGKTVFVGRQGGVERYDCAGGKLLDRFTESSYISFALSADGKWLALHCQPANGDFTPIIHLREIATGKNRISLEGQRGNCNQCQWSADGKRILSSSYSVNLGKPNGEIRKIQGSICVWDVATGKKLNDIPNDYNGVALARDGQTAALWDQREGTRVVNVITGQTTCTFKGGASVEFTADSRALIAVDFYSGEPLTLRDATTGKELRRFQGQSFPHFYRGWRRQLAGFSADGRLLAVIAGDWKQDGTVQLWNVATGKLINNHGSHFDTVTSVAFAGHGKLVASGSLDATVRLWEPTTGKQLGQLEGHKAGVTAIAFSGDGKTLASSSKDGSTRLWDVANQRELAKLDGPAGGAASLTFAADGKTLIAGGSTAVLKVWELVGFKEMASFPTGHDGSVFAVSGDGKLALSANGEVRNDQSTEQLRLWGLPAGKQLLTVNLRTGEKNHDDIVSWAAALSSDGRLFAVSHSRASNTLRGTMYADHTVRVWERATGQELHKMPALKGHALAFSPDGRLLAIGHGNTFTFHNHSPDSRVTLWDMATGESIRVCPGHTNEVACVAFSADGKLLASGSADHTILIWGNVRPASLRPGLTRPTAKQQGMWWDDLKGATPVSRAATVQLLARPELTVQWIREYVKPTPPVDQERIGPLLVALDSPKFKERQKAIVALEALGELAEGRLRQLLAGNPTLECRKRAELLLAKSEQSLSPEQLRNLRAVAVLEWIGTAEARELLAALAKGEPESRLTRLAQAARARMLAAQASRK